MYGECISLYTLLKDMHISPVPRGILLFMGIGSGDRCGRKPGTPPPPLSPEKFFLWQIWKGNGIHKFVIFE